LKLKMLVVVTLLVLGCSAGFAQTSLGFLGYNPVIEYCNYETMTISGFYLQGYDVLSSCPYSPVSGASIEGFAINVPKSASAPVTGSAYVYADQLYDAYSNAFTGEQWAVITKTKPSTKLFEYGWAGYVGFAGYEFLGNYGYLSGTLPAVQKQIPVGKTTVSSLGLAKVKAMRAAAASKK
jgi:hypothetical protein